MTRIYKVLPILLTAMMFYFTQPMHSFYTLHAQSDVTNEGLDQLNDVHEGTPSKDGVSIPPDGLSATGARQTCTSLPEAAGGTLLGKIIPCLIHTIENSTEKFSAELIEKLKPLLYSFMTLVVTLFGVKVLQGEREIHVQAFTLVLKIAFVIGMLEIIPTKVVPWSYAIISDGVSIVTNTVGPDSDNMTCDIAAYGNDDTPLIWKQMDCVLGKLYGFATGEPGPDGKKPVNMVLAASGAGLLSGFLFGGTAGVAVFFAMLGVLWTIGMLVFRTALAFMNGYLIVCVLLILSPIFLPLVLMRVTMDYFDKWWKAIMGGLLLPIIVSAFSMFALIAYDGLLFEPDSEFQELFDYQTIQDALQLDRKPCDMTVTNNPDAKAAPNATESDIDKLFKDNPFVQNMVQPLLSGGSDTCSMLKIPVFDPTKVDAPGFEDRTEIFEGIFKTCIKLLIMAFLIGEGVKTVQGTVSSLTGSGMAGTALNARSETETKLTTAFEEMQGKMKEGFIQRDAKGNAVRDENNEPISARGADFLKATPNAARSFVDTAKDLMSQVRKN
jgi:hypothetical protein